MIWKEKMHFMFFEEKISARQNGYYIYYEKNPMMHELSCRTQRQDIKEVRDIMKK